MQFWKQLCVVAITAGALMGCQHKTDKVGRVRPPVDELSDNGRGLQGKDVISVSDKMAQDLLGIREINQSPTQLLIVVDRVDNKTVTQRFDMDIFLKRLKVKLGEYGNGRVQLLENRAKLRELQSRELDGAPADRFGQGGTNAPVVPGRIQPDYGLYAVISELPNNDTTYFYLEFTLTNLKTGALLWTRGYDVSTYR